MKCSSSLINDMTKPKIHFNPEHQLYKKMTCWQFLNASFIKRWHVGNSSITFQGFIRSVFSKHQYGIFCLVQVKLLQYIFTPFHFSIKERYEPNHFYPS